MKKSILFIINPISGGKNKSGFLKILNKHLDLDIYDASCIFTEYRGHACAVAGDAVHHYDIIVAVGGDGTVNEIASAIEGSDKILGIIPCGSGNGLARALQIPMDHTRAVKRINTGTHIAIDCGVLRTMETKKFFNMAGLGFDAHISAMFASDEKRGIKGYIKAVFHEISTYKARSYSIEIDGQTYVRRAMMLSLANSSQFGNNAHVSPHALVNDGLLDICIIKQFPLIQFPVMAWRMFNKTAHKSKYIEIVQGKTIKINRDEPGPVHLDGEPVYEGKEIAVFLKPLSLNVLV